MIANEQFTAGFHYRDYKVVRSTPVPELHVHLYELVHEPSGAQIMHLANDDQENLFCLSFKTLPKTSNGVAHILEHTVLCGSKKFPVRDPFFSMTRRSLNTYMNALTGQDFTCYPAASQVEKDFYNLLEVYIDAVFHPSLDHLSFLQEGHRLEFATPSDSTSNLECKGIVYNEMKGALSSPMTRLMEAVSNALFPDVPYGCNSGGDPKEIPTLTHKELIEFHKEHYHPSQCLFFFYGNLPLSKHLDYLLKDALFQVSPHPSPQVIPHQPRFLSPRSHEIVYPLASQEIRPESCFITFGWLTCSALDQVTCLGLAVLESILMDTDASELKLALIQTGLCSQAHTSVDFELPDVPFAIHLIGCRKESMKALEECLFTTLHSITVKGIDSKKVDIALDSMELSRSEITGNGTPYGLSLFFRAALTKQHGGDPLHGLEIHSLFAELRAKIEEEPNFLIRLIHEYFINNKHFIRLLMRPDPEYSAKEAEVEKNHLLNIQKNLTEPQKKTIIENAEKLLKIQEDQAEITSDCLPSISLNDAPQTTRDFKLNFTNFGDKETLTHSVFTNNIGYIDIIRPIPKIDQQDTWLLRLFTNLLSQLGSGGRNYQDNLKYMQEHTGGVSAAIHLNVQSASPNDYSPTFHIRGKALTPKLPKLGTLLFDTWTSPDFTDAKRIKELIMKQMTSLEASFNSSAIRYAMSEAASSFSDPSYLSDLCYGLPYFQKLRDLVRFYDAKEEWLLTKLQTLADTILNSASTEILLTCDDDTISRATSAGYWGLLDLPSKAHKHWQFQKPTVTPTNCARPISSPVAFSTLVIPTISYNHKDAPYLNLVAQLLENTHLHRQIREQGGAYGAGSSFNAMSGTFSFYSYRDPNIVATLDAFKDSVIALSAGTFDEEDLEEAQREIIQGYDTPIAPGSRGEIAYGWWKEGKTHAMRQANRLKTLSATCQEIQRAVSEHLLPQLEKGSFITYSGDELIESENMKLKASKRPIIDVKPL